MTRKRRPSIEMSLSMGSRKGKRASATSAPSTATWAALLTSIGEKNRPREM